VEQSQQYSAAEMERMMKIQEVLLRAMAKKITWWQAAEIIGVTDRTMRRWRERIEEQGYSGLSDGRKGRPSPRRVPLSTAEEVLRLYQEVYYDLNMQHFHEKLREEHGIELSYAWVQKALQGAGLVAKRHKRGAHRRRRPRRPLPGMLLHIDGSKHGWLNDGHWYDLIVILDDANSEIYLCAVGGRRIHAHGDDCLAPGDRETRVVLCSVQRSRQSLFRDAEGWRSSG
jgi:transposase